MGEVVVEAEAGVQVDDGEVVGTARGLPSCAAPRRSAFSSSVSPPTARPCHGAAKRTRLGAAGGGAAAPAMTVSSTPCAWTATSLKSLPCGG